MVLASAASLVTPRSATCGAACRTEPCTLRQIRAAERALADESVLVVWSELSVVAHLVGEPMPILGRAMLDALATWHPRLRECVVSQAVDAAVVVRSRSFATRLSPAGLADHVCRSMHGWVNEDRSACYPGEDRRWCIVTPTAQGLEHPPDAAQVREISHGVESPSALERAIGCVESDPAWAERLGEALGEFPRCDWPLHYLVSVSHEQ